MQCPACKGAMERQVFDAQLKGSVEIDACPRCRAFWFDTYESLHLTPRATLQIFAFIGEHSKGNATPWPNTTRCPRCGTQLTLAYDRQRATSFQYLKCPAGHGRFEAFVDFLREKDFIRPLSKEQLAELREKVQSVHCSNCGAPIDLAKESFCTHCRAPLSMIDTKKINEIAKMAATPARPLILPAVRPDRRNDLIDMALESVSDWLHSWFE